MKRNLLTIDVLLSAIRAKCMDCSGNARRLVEQCCIADCPLHPYRSIQAVGEAQERQTKIDGQVDLFEVLNQMKGA